MNIIIEATTKGIWYWYHMHDDDDVGATLYAWAIMPMANLAARGNEFIICSMKLGNYEMATLWQLSSRNTYIIEARNQSLG